MAPPVYVRHEIVHNRYVVESLRAKGAIFVEELAEIPDTDAPVIFSAHGVREIGAGGGRSAAICSRSTPPVRWSPRCIARPKSITGAAARSC